MLVSFPTNIHKLRSEEELPSYDCFSEKWSKTSKNPKINKVIHLASIQSEEESTSEDSEEDPEIVQKMAMLSNKLQYLAKKKQKFLSRSSSDKSSRREKKGYFNCKKTGHFIAECPDLQKDKTKDKSKKPIFKSNKFKKQIKKSLMATWEDLDNESESEEEEA